MPRFTVQGQIYHNIGSLLPLQGEEHKFLQVYFMGDPTLQIQKRMRCNKELREFLIFSLQEMLNRENDYIKKIKTAIELMTDQPDLKIVIRADKTPQGEHERKYNAPTTDEVAIIMAGDTSHPRDIVLQQRDCSLKKVNEI